MSWPQALRALMFSSSFSDWFLLVYLKLKLCMAFFLLFSSAIARMLGCVLNSCPKLCSLGTGNHSEIPHPFICSPDNKTAKK